MRHCVDSLLEAIEQQVTAPPQLPWRERLQRLVRLTCGIDVAELPYFDAGMLLLESQIAEPKHHQRVYQELSEKWIAAFAALARDPALPPSTETVRALYLSVWSGRRYWLLVDAPEFDGRAWMTEMVRLCCLACAVWLALKPISNPTYSLHGRPSAHKKYMF